MSNDKAKFLFHVYFHYKNKKKHEEDAKFDNNAELSANSASSA